MSIQTLEELENTRQKLCRLEAHYLARKVQPATDPDLRATSLRSVKRVINQLKEEMIRFEAGVTDRRDQRGIQSPEELANTQEKRHLLDERYQRGKRELTGDNQVRRLSLQSLKRTINQLTEEIVRYEARVKVQG